MHYYSQSISVESMTSSLLDAKLALGWYRMSDKFFTTSFIRFGDRIYNTVWLRINLKGFEYSSTQLKLKKLNSAWRIEFEPLTLDDEMEVLFASYKTIAKFDTAHSLMEHLYSKSKFHKLSHCVKIFDGPTLIGCGIYEQGMRSLEGLISFYHADYQKYSLGKFLILSKIEYAISLGYDYYYLGYYIPEYPKFDYKLAFSKTNTEYFDPKSQEWHTLHQYDDYYDEVEQMYLALLDKSKLLTSKNIEHRLAKNPFFDMNIYFDFEVYTPLMMPWYILVGEDTQIELDGNAVIVYYDTRDDNYMIGQCTVYGYVPNYAQMSADFFDEKIMVMIDTKIME